MLHSLAEFEFPVLPDSLNLIGLALVGNCVTNFVLRLCTALEILARFRESEHLVCLGVDGSVLWGVLRPDVVFGRTYFVTQYFRQSERTAGAVSAHANSAIQSLEEALTDGTTLSMRVRSEPCRPRLSRCESSVICCQLSEGRAAN